MSYIDVYTLIIPLLKTIETKEEYKLSEIADEVADNTDLSEEQLSILTPNGERLFDSKLGTANTYLKKIGFIETTRFLYYKISEKGIDLLKSNPESVTEEDLLKYPEFREYKKVFAPPEVDAGAKTIFEENLKQNLAQFKEFKKNKESLNKDIESDENNEFEEDDFEYDKKDSKKCKCKGRKHKKGKCKDKKCKCKHYKHKCGHKKHKVFSPAKELTRYADLLERGYLTEEEYENKKKELLAIKY